jgi:predicted DNA-binding transcriptional regulator AlpA
MMIVRHFGRKRSKTLEKPRFWRNCRAGNGDLFGKSGTRRRTMTNELSATDRGQGQPAMEPMLGVDDLARVLACGRRTVERMRGAGNLPAPRLRVGRMPRWEVAAIRQWIARGGAR